jgi:hypothetical protein
LEFGESWEDHGENNKGSGDQKLKGKNGIDFNNEFVSGAFVEVWTLGDFYLV